MDNTESTVDGMQWILMFVVILQLLSEGSGMIFVIWMRTLAYILHLPLLNIAFPGNTSRFFELTLLIALFDYVENFYEWDESSELFNSNVQFKVIDQIKNIGYDSHNSMINLNTVALVIMLTSARLLLAGLTTLMHKFCCR